MRSIILLILVFSGLLAKVEGEVPADSRPNIVWIISDDHGPELGVYGVLQLKTPRLDRLAEEGYLFTNAHATSPICSPSRTAFMTGVYQTTLGGHHHRSNRENPLPEGIVPITELFRAAGYFVSNNDGHNSPGKTDLNFAHGELFDGVSWRERADGQPFFAQINIFPPHRPFVKALNDPTDPATLTLPPYWPDDPTLREDLAQYYDSIRLLDVIAGATLDRLDEEGLLENTWIFFFADNGRPFARDKQFLYKGGTHVPLIIRPPGGLEKMQKREDLLTLLDVSVQTLKLAGIKIPEYIHGQTFLEEDAPKRKYIVTARDRADETVDRIRAVRTLQYSYIRNYHPELPYLQPNGYKRYFYPDWRFYRADFEKKSEPSDFLFLRPEKPAEELYDYRNDPYELTNLADDPKYSAVLLELRGYLDYWIVQTGDRGHVTEDPRIIESVREEIEATFPAGEIWTSGATQLWDNPKEW